MNNILFRVAELEEKLQQLMDSENDLERLIATTQMETLDVFKHYPIRSHEESWTLLQRFNHVFGFMDEQAN